MNSLKPKSTNLLTLEVKLQRIEANKKIQHHPPNFEDWNQLRSLTSSLTTKTNQSVQQQMGTGRNRSFNNCLIRKSRQEQMVWPKTQKRCRVCS